MAIDITAWHLDLVLQEHGDLYANNENGRAGRATEVLFNGPTGQAFFQWWRDMVKEDLAINVGRNLTGADTFLAMGAGRTAMTVGSSSALRSVVDVLEGGLAQTEVELGVANQPGVPGGTRPAWRLRSRPVDHQLAPQGGAGGGLEVHQVAHGARTAGRVVRRQRLPARQHQGV